MIHGFTLSDQEKDEEESVNSEGEDGEGSAVANAMQEPYVLSSSKTPCRDRGLEDRQLFEEVPQAGSRRIEQCSACADNQHMEVIAKHQAFECSRTVSVHVARLFAAGRCSTARHTTGMYDLSSDLLPPFVNSMWCWRKDPD